MSRMRQEIKYFEMHGTARYGTDVTFQQGFRGGSSMDEGKHIIAVSKNATDISCKCTFYLFFY